MDTVTATPAPATVPKTADHGIGVGGEILTLALQPGESAFIRRSSLVFAKGDFGLTTHRIARTRINIFALFSGDVRWANRYDAKDGPVTLMAARDYPGRIVALPVSPDRPLFLQPTRYLAHRGDLTFNVRRVAKKEFWTLAEVRGTGRVYIKLPGEPKIVPLSSDGAIVDTNYIAAVSGEFKAYGKVFTSGEVMKSGELSNVRLSGAGHFVLQSQNPEEAGNDGGGGIIGSILNALPF
ncbi:MAG: AIM24 family protein [Pseudomonadota bacterium]